MAPLCKTPGRVDSQHVREASGSLRTVARASSP